MTELSLPEGVELRLLPPTSLRIRTHRPEWEAWIHRRCAGRIVQWKVLSARAIFYRAIGYHSRTGEPISLESSTDLAERVEKVADCWQNPDNYIHRSSWE